VIQDDGQNFDAFTRVGAEGKKKAAKIDTKKQVEHLNAVEDILLDDFSLGDEDSDGANSARHGSTSSRTSSVESNKSLNIIRRNKGK